MASRDVVRHSRQTSPNAYEVSCRVRVGDHPAFTPANRPKSTAAERASPQGASLDAPQVGPRSCQADVDNLECGDRTRRTASRAPSGRTESHHRTQGEFECHIQVTESP